MVLLVFVLMSGCSNNEPQITEVLIENERIEGQKIYFDLKVRVAKDGNSEAQETYVIKLSDINSDYSKQKEGVFMIGDKNSYVVFDLSEEDYENKELAVKLELIQGTKTLDEVIERRNYK